VTKIAFIGAGSWGFTRNLVHDLLQPAAPVGTPANMPSASNATGRAKTSGVKKRTMLQQNRDYLPTFRHFEV
jgi:hypothetical protein